MKKFLTILGVMFFFTGMANASTLTMTSLTSKGALPTGVTEVGGIVLDLVGSNGTRVTSQLAASSLYRGYFYKNPGMIGTQTGFDSTILAALGGGIKEAAVRLTVFDGDTASNDFDWNDNTFFLNNVNFGNFSNVLTDRTNDIGTISYSTEFGFKDSNLNTGFFYSNDSSTLSSLYNSLSGGTVTYSLSDTDPYDNYFDFTKGVNGSLIDIGSTPNVVTPIPAAFWLLGSGIAGLAGLRRRKKNTV